MGHQQAIESNAACCTVGCKLSVLCTIGTQAADLYHLECATLFSYIAQPFGGIHEGIRAVVHAHCHIRDVVARVGRLLIFPKSLCSCTLILQI